MKTIKNILAWLDWSTFSTEDNQSTYNLPYTSCELLWRTLLSLVLMVYMIPFHLYNFIFINKEDYKHGNYNNIKASKVSGGAIQLILLFGFSMWITTIENEMVDFLSYSDSFLLSYLKIYIAAIIPIISIILVIVVGFIIFYLFKYIFEYFSNRNDKKIKIKEDSKMKILYDTIRKKYCFKINWKDIGYDKEKHNINNGF